MKLDIRICKICNLEKERVTMGRYPKGSNRHVDRDGNFWNGKTCPQCNKERIKKAMGELRVSRKETKVSE